MVLKFLGRIPAGAFRAFRTLRDELRARENTNYATARTNAGSTFTGTLFRGSRDFSRYSLITHRTTRPLSPPPLSTFDPAEMYIARNLTRRNFRREHGGLIEANWKSIDRICGMRTIAAPAAITPVLRRITDYRSMQMRGVQYFTADWSGINERVGRDFDRFLSTSAWGRKEKWRNLSVSI